MANASATRPAEKKGDGISAGTVAVLGTLAALIAGAYLFGGSEAKKRRKVVRGWAMRAKAEVLEAIEAAGSIDKQTYLDTVDSVVKRYQSAKEISSTELESLAKELRGYWKEAQASLAEMAKKKQTAPAKKRRIANARS